MSDEQEEWRPVVGYEDRYEVSDHGRVRSLGRVIPVAGRPSRTMNGRALQPVVVPTGYAYVSIAMRDPKRPKKRSEKWAVHTLVAAAFLGPRPGRMHIAHWDGDGLNNRLDNLRYATAKENYDDKRRHGTVPLGAATKCAKVTPDQVLEIRRLAASGLSHPKIGAIYGVGKTAIRNIALRQTWAWVPEGAA